MASTPSSRQRLASSNSQIFTPFSKSPGRNRTYEPRLFLKRVVGTTCTSPTGFDAAGQCFAYIAGGAVVVVDVQGAEYSQRFFRARPSTAPVYALASTSQASPSPSTTPKANDARNRVAKTSRESSYASQDGGDSPSLKTWTSRERIKAATCVSLSRDGRFLAVGETGYAPRVLIFNLKDTSSDRPLVSISEHDFGVRAVAWSQDGRYLASLGTANDGFLFIWRIDPRTGSAKLFQQNRCTSHVNGMIWLGSSHLITYGTRHIRAWKIVDELQRPTSSSKKAYTGDVNPQNAQKTLPGRNVLLGSLLEASFTCGVTLDESRALLASDGGDVCLLDDTSGQMKLSRLAGLGFASTCCSRRGPLAIIAGNNGQMATFGIEALITGTIQEITTEDTSETNALAAMGYVQDQLVTVKFDRSIDVWKAESLPGHTAEQAVQIKLPGHNEPLLGIQKLNTAERTFLTWSSSGRVLLWGLDGCLRKTVHVTVNEVQTGNEMEPWNQLCVVRSDDQGNILAAGDRIGMLRVVDHATGEVIFETKAHSTEITHIAVHYDASRAAIVTCGRDRTVQIFHRFYDGSFELLQTLEYPSRVTDLLLSSDQRIITCSMDRNIRVHELISKIGEPDTLAAVQCRSIAIKASPTSLALDPDSRSLWASALDRTVYQFDLETGRQLGAFKCVDENGSETVVLDSLNFGPAGTTSSSFLLGMSNTDKSIRMYDPSTGAFVDREWGHTESINGVVLVEDDDTSRKAVSAGCDGTIMIWDVDSRDSPLGATSRSPSPAKDGIHGPNQPPLRRILSKAELAEFQRPSSSQGSRESPPRTLRNRKSRTNLSSSCTSSAKTPTYPTHRYNSPSNGSIIGDSPSRRTSSSRSCSSPIDTSPKNRTLSRRPSLPALGSTPSTHAGARKKSSAINLRSSYNFGSLQLASEQTCRQLRAYREKLSSTEPLSPEMTAELENELRLTVTAIGERRANRGQQAITESVLGELLDQYSDKLVAILDEKLRLRLEASGVFGPGEAQTQQKLALLRPPTNEAQQRRPRTACGTTAQLVNS